MHWSHVRAEPFDRVQWVGAAVSSALLLHRKSSGSRSFESEETATRPATLIFLAAGGGGGGSGGGDELGGGGGAFARRATSICYCGRSARRASHATAGDKNLRLQVCDLHSESKVCLVCGTPSPIPPLVARNQPDQRRTNKRSPIYPRNSLACLHAPVQRRMVKSAFGTRRRAKARILTCPSPTRRHKTAPRPANGCVSDLPCDAGKKTLQLPHSSLPILTKWQPWPPPAIRPDALPALRHVGQWQHHLVAQDERRQPHVVAAGGALLGALRHVASSFRRRQHGGDAAAAAHDPIANPHGRRGRRRGQAD